MINRTRQGYSGRYDRKSFTYNIHKPNFVYETPLFHNLGILILEDTLETNILYFERVVANFMTTHALSAKQVYFHYSYVLIIHVIVSTHVS